MADNFKIDNNPITNKLGINRTTIVAEGINLAEELVRIFFLHNVRILQKPKSKYQIPQGDAPDDPLYMTAMGTPVFSDITFIGGTYTDDNGNFITFDDITLETVLITLDQPKNIVKTPIQGRKGTVKEYIGMGDYSVKIDGLLMGGNGIFPRELLTQMKNMLTAPISIQVTSWLLQLFDIDYIVIDSYSIPQNEGNYSQQPFSINALSDDDVQLVFQ